MYIYFNHAILAVQEINFHETFNFAKKKIYFNKFYVSYTAINNLHFGFIWKISITTILINKVYSLVMTSLVDVYKFNWDIEECVLAMYHTLVT